MNGLHLVTRDIKAMWRHVHGRIALVFLLLVPLIYAGFFLAGYWNPYGQLEKLPVAIVNEDVGATMDDKPLKAGEDFVAQLKESKDLNYKFVSPSKAEKGIESGKYYMIVTIPKSFSEKVTTLMDETPEQAKLQYKVNPGKNFVASQISSSAVEKMTTKINNSITKAYSDGVFSKFQALATGLGEAGDGAKKLNEGTLTAKDGLAQLATGIQALKTGADQLESGGDKLLTAQDKLASGANALQSGSAILFGGMTQLTQGHHTLESGMEQLSEGTKNWTKSQELLVQGTDKTSNTANKLNKTLTQYVQEHPETAQDPNFQEILALSAGLEKAASSLSDGQTKLSQGAAKIMGSQAKVEAGMEQFGTKFAVATSGAEKLKTGSSELAGGFTQWQQSFSSMNTGIASLASGSKKLNTGSTSLQSGLASLADGSDELAVKLKDASDKTAALHYTDSTTTMFSEPVKLIKTDVSDVPNYGAGIAPYFLSLAFYVGGIMASNILPLGRRQDLKVSGTVHFINKLGLVYVIGLVQALLVDAVVLFGFNLHVASVPLFILSSIIVSFTFMTFILMLITVFGLVGKFAAVTLLVFQLATCGGTFPGELTFPILSHIGSILPMAHSLQGMQDVISLGDWSHLQGQIWILIAYLLAAGIIAWMTSHWQHIERPSKTETA